MSRFYYPRLKMKFRSEKKPFKFKRTAFSLIEAVAALIILAMVCAGVLFAINNSLTSAADNMLKMQAFEVARENLETLLGSASVKESIESGTSEKYPAIEWQNTVETFYDPITQRLWVRAVCSAEYPSPDGETAKIELTNWLTNLSKQQVLEYLKEKEKEKQFLDQSDRFIETIEDAATYAGVDEETIQGWVENGMPLTEDGFFIKSWLDLYKNADGKPTTEQIKQVEDEEKQKENPPEKQEKIPEEELNQMSFCERIKYLLATDEGRVSFDEAVRYVDECLQ